MNGFREEPARAWVVLINSCLVHLVGFWASCLEWLFHHNQSSLRSLMGK